MLTTTNTFLLAGLSDPANESVWREFHARYRPVLLAFARRLGLDEERAQDAAQETLLCFVEEYRAGRYERDRGRLRAWIFGIARARVLDLQRKSARDAGMRGESALCDVGREAGWDAVWDAEWRAAILRQALRELRAVSAADPKTLRAFELVALEGKAPADVAAELGISASAVYLAKHRTLERLRGLLARLEQDF